MIKKSQNTRISKVLITFCLFLLFNPLVKMVDIFPDFIAYFVFALMLNRITYFVPHACELRSSLLKLGVFSLLRLPSTELRICSFEKLKLFPGTIPHFV